MRRLNAACLPVTPTSSQPSSPSAFQSSSSAERFLPRFSSAYSNPGRSSPPCLSVAAEARSGERLDPRPAERSAKRGRRHLVARRTPGRCSPQTSLPSLASAPALRRSNRRRPRGAYTHGRGGVRERSNRAVLKTADGATRPWVRIPPPPLSFLSRRRVQARRTAPRLPVPADFWSILRRDVWQHLGEGSGGGIAVKDETNVASAAGIAGRVRALRRAAGMTQVELADGRFTKQYVSQIERGEVVPSDELLAWLADRLGVEPMLIATGLSAADLERVERDLAAGQACSTSTATSTRSRSSGRCGSRSAPRRRAGPTAARCGERRGR